MVDDSKTTSSRGGWLARRGEPPGAGVGLGLVIAWSQSEPWRVGEVALVDERLGERVLGRGPPRADDPFPRLEFGRQRPGSLVPAGPLECRRISRDQLRIRPSKGELAVTEVGRCPLFVGGARAPTAVVRAGDTLMLEDELVLLCCARPAALPALTNDAGAAGFAFGGEDRHGIVGESPSAWALREQVAFFAARDGHVLLLGESGAGKELAARAIHDLSPRAKGPFVARNAATLPTGVIDAELFGHARNYPTAGMPERRGLLGEAQGGTLFLDEIGELPQDLQAHLLRLLDRGGEYHRLGESEARRADVRLVAATNRPEEHLKHDLLARLTLRLEVPGLSERREDVPLLVSHVLRRAAASDATIGARFFEGWGGATPTPRVDPRLVELLLRHAFTHNVRELEMLLWSAMATSHEGYIALTDDVAARSRQGATPLAALTPDRIQAVLDEHDGNQERAYRALGLSSRDALYRLIKKHGLSARRSR
jgi:DNA-binding NtrC family response regulator